MYDYEWEKRADDHIQSVNSRGETRKGNRKRCARARRVVYTRSERLVCAVRVWLSVHTNTNMNSHAHIHIPLWLGSVSSGAFSS